MMIGTLPCYVIVALWSIKTSLQAADCEYKAEIQEVVTWDSIIKKRSKLTGESRFLGEPAVNKE